jgi:hypothetical protein
MAIFAVAGILASSTLLLRLPIYILPFWVVLLTALCIGYGRTQSPWDLAFAVLASASISAPRSRCMLPGPTRTG